MQHLRLLVFDICRGSIFYCAWKIILECILKCQDVNYHNNLVDAAPIRQIFELNIISYDRWKAGKGWQLSKCWKSKLFIFEGPFTTTTNWISVLNSPRTKVWFQSAYLSADFFYHFHHITWMVRFRFRPVRSRWMWYEWETRWSVFFMQQKYS